MTGTSLAPLAEKVLNMETRARRAAAAAYKERKVEGGVYAVRCVPTGQIWVGQWPNLEAVQTRLWFTLRHGRHPRGELLAAWRTHGEEQFSFEVLERIENEKSEYLQSAKLKERVEHWRMQLRAAPI